MGKVQRGANAKSIGYEHTRAEFFREKLRQKANNEDTIIRTELQGIIVARVNEGIDKEEIINELSSNQRYTKYERFFESWVDNVIRKNEIVRQRNETIRLNNEEKEQ